MGNPARELAKLLGEWRVIKGATNVHKQRGTERSSIEGWRAQVRAVALLAEVDQFLTSMSEAGVDVEHYQRWLPQWAGAIFVPDRQWGANANANGERLFDQSVVDMANAVADFIHTTQIGVNLSAERKRTSLDALDEIARDLGSEDVQLTEIERRYIFELISSCRAVFQESSSLGTVDLLRRVHELLGVLTLLAETLSEDPKTKDLAKRLLRAARRVVPYAVFGGRVAAGSLGAAADLLQLTDGLG